MQTITIKLKEENVDFFIELLKKLNYFTEIKITKSTIDLESERLDLPIRLPKGEPAISDFAGLWMDTPKTLKQIREKAWKRI